jgi:hypothetical protein
MTEIPYRSALIIGAGPGISGSLARLLRAAGIPVVVAARQIDRLTALAAETGAVALPVDASDAGQVERLFAETEARIGAPEIVVYNASGRVRGPIAELDPVEVEKALAVSALGAFYAVRQAAQPHGPGRQGRDPAHRRHRGGQGLRALRALRDGQVRPARPGAERRARAGAAGHPCRPYRRRWRRARRAHRPDPADRPDSTLDPDAVAQCYVDLLRQHRSAWSWEIEVRPWVEKF